MDQFESDPETLVATLAGRIKADIVGGAYPPGSTLPSTRALAAELGVSRTSLTFVYEQLAAEGYIRTRPGARAAIAYDPQRPRTQAKRIALAQKVQPRLSTVAMHLLSAGLPATRETPPRFDFRYGALAQDDFPKEAWRRVIVSALLQRQGPLAYGNPAGNDELRQALWAYLRRTRGIHCELKQICIVQGSQQGLDLIARLLLNPRDFAAVENPGYPMAALAFEAAGARILNVPVDTHGVVTDALDEFRRAKVMFLTPSHQFPLGGILPIGRRLKLLEWAEQQNVYLIEDDYDGEYRYDSRPVDALFSLDGANRVLYIGTVSKTLSPQLRLGYVVAPLDLADGLTRLKNITDRTTTRYEQLALAKFIASGGYEQHVRRMRRRNAKRRQVLIETLQKRLGDRCRIQGTDAGLHVVIWLPAVPCTRELEIAEAAYQVGLGLYPVHPLFRGPRPKQWLHAGFIVGYASLSPDQIKEGITRLADVLPVPSLNAH